MPGRKNCARRGPRFKCLGCLFDLQAITSKMKSKTNNEKSKNINIKEKKEKSLMKKQRRKNLKQKCISITKNNIEDINLCSQPDGKFENNSSIDKVSMDESKSNTVSEFDNICDGIFNPDYYVSNDNILNSQLY